MTHRTYTPQPGTLPFRAIEWLKAQPAGHQVGSGELAEALDVDVGSITTTLKFAAKHGALRVERRGTFNVWSLGDGTPEPLPHDWEPERPMRRQLQDAAQIVTECTEPALEPATPPRRRGSPRVRAQPTVNDTPAPTQKKKRQELEIDRLGRLLEVERVRAEKAWEGYRTALYDLVEVRMKLDAIKAVLAGDEEARRG